ncbi:hypothetical protein GEMRC1_006463 [Eukaryota sp. GEM-RC1]
MRVTRSTRSRSKQAPELSLDDVLSSRKPKTTSQASETQKRLSSERRKIQSQLKEEQEREATINKLLHKSAVSLEPSAKQSRTSDVDSVPKLRYVHSSSGVSISFPPDVPSTFTSAVAIPPPPKVCSCGRNGIYPKLIGSSKSYFCSFSCFNSSHSQSDSVF